MAKRKIVISELGNDKKKTSLKVNSGIVKKVIIAAIVLAILAVGVIKVIDSTTNYIGTVDGRKIYVYEYLFQLKTVESEMTADISGDVEKEAFWNQMVDGKSNRQIAKEKALQKCIEQKVKLSEAKARGIELDNRQLKEIILNADASIDSARAQYKQYYGLDYSRNEYVRNATGMNYTQYKEQSAFNWITTKLDNIEKSKIDPTDEEKKAWYEKNKDEYDLYEIRRIFISFLDDDDKLLEGDKLKEKEDKVAEIENKLAEGTKVGSLAKDYTEKSSEQDNEGTYKFKKDEADVDEIEKWVETAEKDTYTKIEIKDDDDKVTGVYFVEYKGKITYDTPDSADARNIQNTVKDEVIEDKYTKIVEDWTKQDKYKVNFNGNIYENIKVAGMKA